MVGASDAEGDGTSPRGRSARKRMPNRRYADMELLSPTRAPKRPRQSSAGSSSSMLTVTKQEPADEDVLTAVPAVHTPPATGGKRSVGRPRGGPAAAAVAASVATADVRRLACSGVAAADVSGRTEASSAAAAAAPPRIHDGCVSDPPVAISASSGDSMPAELGSPGTAAAAAAEQPLRAPPDLGCDGLAAVCSASPEVQPEAADTAGDGPLSSADAASVPPTGASDPECSAPAAAAEPAADGAAPTTNDAAANSVGGGEEPVMSGSGLVCSEAADAQVPVDAAILLLTSDDGAADVQPTAGSSDCNADDAGTGSSENKMAAGATVAVEYGGESGGGVSSHASLLPTGLQQEGKPRDVTRRVAVVTSKSFSPSMLSEASLKALESVNVGSDASMQTKDIIVEIVMDHASSGGGTSTVNVALDGSEDSGSAGHSAQQDFDVKYVHFAGEGKEVFRCTQCDYETDRRPNFYKHKKRHLESRPYKCSDCEYSARTSSNLKRHVLSHTNERRFSCDRCDLKFRQKIHLEKHVKYIHEEKSVKCPLCDYTCANENPDLKLHMKRKHLTTDPNGPRTVIQCGRCGFIAASKRDLKQHFKFHKRGPELKLYCEQCSFVTDCESRLTRHMLTHSQVKPFPCPMCDYKATQREHVNRHMKNIHKVDLPTQPSDRQKRQRASPAFSESAVVSAEGQYRVVVSKKYDPPDFTDKQKVFGCLHCTMKFCKLINLYKHLHAQHASLLPPASEDGAHSCVICDFKSTSKKNLLVHMRKHNASALLTDHDGSADVEVPGKVYTCVLCEYINPTRRNLYQHLKKKHKISLMVKRDGTANCIVEPNAAVTVVASDESQQVTEVIPMMGADDSGSAHAGGKGPEVGRVVNIEELANSLMRPLLATSLPGFNPNAVVATGEDDDDGGSDSDGMEEDEEEDGTAEGDAVMVGAHGLVTGVAASGGVVSSAPAAEQLVRHQAAEAIVGLAAGAGSSSAAVHGLSNMMVMTVVGSTAIAGSDGVRHIQLPTELSSQLSSGDYLEVNGEMFKVLLAPSDDDDGTVQPAAFAGGTSLLLQNNGSEALA